jgi:hypothetical protein
MLNELEEFKAYTTPVRYEVSRKGDTSFLGRFTFESLLNFEGLGRILTILARGYLPDLDRARNALCAWCSIPDSKNATPKEEWQNRTDFRGLHENFPELVDENGAGWFYRHVHSVAKFVLDHPDAVRKGYTEYAEAIQRKFDKMWRDKVLQFQTPIFSLNTKGAWTLLFDDIIADALEQGPLQNYKVTIPEELRQRIEKQSGKKAAPYICDLIAYYHAHREDDYDWVVLPVTSFDMYYGGSYFSKRILSTIPEEILERQSHMGTCRYRIAEDFLP